MSNNRLESKDKNKRSKEVGTQTWGEPRLRLMEEEEEMSWIFTDCSLPVKKSGTQLQREGLGPSVLSLCTRVCGIEGGCEVQVRLN